MGSGYLWGFYEEEERALRSLPTQPFCDWEIRSLLTCCSALILCNKEAKKKKGPKAIISRLKELSLRKKNPAFIRKLI